MKKISKEAILNACIEKQEALINSFEGRVAEMKEDAYGKEQSASQSEDRAAGKIELLSNFEQELKFAQMEMGYLKTLDPMQEKDKIEPGAVAITNQRNFFVAISSEKVDVNGTEVFGLSTNAPIYSAMKDLKKGDQFEFNGIKYSVEDVY